MTITRSDISRICVVFLCLLTLSTFFCGASSKDNSKNIKNPYEGYDEEIFMDMDFEPNLALPSVPESLNEPIRKYVFEMANRFKVGGNIDILRKGEVMLVTIPTDRLFDPNDTLLAKETEKVLLPLLQPLDDPMTFKLVIAVHTDDTGSDSYRNELSMGRLNSIYDWFIEQIDEGNLNENQIIIPFSMGSSMPITDNDSRRHRSENRRLEIYYVPGPKLIDMASKGLLK